MNPFSKPLNIVVTVVVVILIITGIITGLQLTKQSVSINMTGSDYKTVLYDGTQKEGREVATITTSAEFTLSNSYYCYVVVGENYSDEENCFTVYNNKTTIDISPKYSNQYLSTLLNTETPLINTSFEETYGSMLGSYEMIKGELAGNGDWYVGILKEKVVNPGEIFDTYVFIMNKKDNKWTVAEKPSLVISARTNSSTPKNIIDLANNHLNSYVKSLDD